MLDIMHSFPVFVVTGDIAAKTDVMVVGVYVVVCSVRFGGWARCRVKSRNGSSLTDENSSADNGGTLRRLPHLVE